MAVCVACGAALGPRRRYCNQNCYHAGKAQRLAPRFWSKVCANAVDDCWEWRGRKDEHGYGLFAVVGDRSHGAHRWAWRLTHGAVPAGLEVCHRCDNPGCVNPAHLFVGTHTVNMRDAITKGRLKPAAHLRKLTDAQHDDIRRNFQHGSGPALARQYGVTKSTIYRIVNGYPSQLRKAAVA